MSAVAEMHDVSARHHDVFGRATGVVEDVLEEFALGSRQRAGAMGFRQQQAKLFFGVRELDFGRGEICGACGGKAR